MEVIPPEKYNSRITVMIRELRYGSVRRICAVSESGLL